MKKLFLSVLLIASAITFTSAQSATVGTSPEVSKWSIAVKGGGDYFRVTPMSTYGSSQMDKYINDASWGLGVSIEKTFNPLFGLGLDLDYLNYNRNTLKGYTIDPTLFGSLNLTNLFFPHREKSIFNWYYKLGGGAAFYDGTPANTIGVERSSVSPVGATSLLFEWNLSKRVALGVEGGYRTYLKEDLGGIVVPADKDKNNDAWTALINLRFKLGSSTHVRDLTLDKYYPALPPVVKQVENPYDDSQLVNRMDNLDRQNQDIQNRLSKLEDDVKALQNKPAGSAVNASFNNIEFEFDSSKLTEDSYPTLNQIASILKDNPTWGSLKVKGHTDSTGPKAYNQKLSERRAQAVKDYLVSQGVSASVITTEGYGETQPIASNDTAAGRAQNRRVEFEVAK
jgi:OOP family OmpA-OmpF porin